MGVRTYRPTSVLIPDSVSVRRTLRRDRDDYDGRPLPASEVARYDSRTVLYDVWIADNPRRLVAIGPPSINLQEALYPVEVVVNGQKVVVRRTEYHRFCIWSIPLPKALWDTEVYEVSMKFRPFAISIVLHPKQDQADPKQLSIMTLQRDNPIRWITDWCLWHRRLYDVEQVLLYDNGSAYAEQLDSALRAVGTELDVVLVDWPFPYGTQTSDRNRFAQIGALNHCREYFGLNSGWTICLDIDEFLVAEDGRQLLGRFRQRERDGTSVVLFGSWQVPPADDQPPIEERSVRSYSFRERQFTDYALKYAYNPTSVAMNMVHVAFPENAMLDWLAFAPATYERMMSLVYRSLTKRIGFDLFGHKVMLASCDDMFFYHVRGLNTNWKHREQIGNAVEHFDPGRHVRDRQIDNLLSRAGLKEE